MKTLRRLTAATILTLTLTFTVLAGHIDTPGAPAPAPTPATGSTTPTSTTLTSLVQAIIRVIYR